MDINPFAPKELETVFRVLRTSLKPAGELDQPHRKFLETYARITGHRSPDATEPAPIRADAVRIEGAHSRKRLIQLASIAALLNHPVRAESVEFVKELGSSLCVFDPVISVLESLARGAKLKA